MPRLIEDESLVKILSGQESIDPQEMVTRLIYTKAVEWGYEKEWRMFYNLRRVANPINPESQFPTYLVEFPVECVKEVILGCQMPMEKKKGISAIVAGKYPSAKVYEAKISATEFDLDINEFRSQ